MDKAQHRAPVRPRHVVLATLLSVIAIVLVGGGGWLLAIGGSAYYLVAGLMVGGTATLLLRRDRRAAMIYAAMLAATLLWGLWESGWNLWGLQARLFAPTVLGIWVAWTWSRRAGISAAIVFILAVGAIGVSMSGIGDGASQQAWTGKPDPAARGDWVHYGNDLGGSRFSGLTQINASNVGDLKQAWTYRTGHTGSEIGFEATPLMVGDSLYLCTSNNVIIALDPETGKQRWRHDPKVSAPPLAACRGVAYFAGPELTGACAARIIFATTDARLMAVDAGDGVPCPGFGTNGIVDLKRGMGPVKDGYYYVSSAPTIVSGNVIVGGWVRDNQETGEPSGVIRGFNAVTGKFAWAWDMDRPDDHAEPADGQFYSRGTANSWAPMSGDEALGLVYVPTGNATPDYWGGHRSPGSEKYSASVVAIDAKTGQARWSFQTTHHDLWDFDVASQPTLATLRIGGRDVPALFQGTKRGQVFVLDRRTGQPLTEVTEKPVPQGAAAGDYTSPTQPYSTGMPAFDNTDLSEKLMWGATPIDQLWCRIKFREARYDGPMTPPGTRPTVTYPSFSGGMNWGSVSIDAERQLMVVNWTRIANYTRLIPRTEANKRGVSASADGHISIDALLPQMGTPFAAQTAAFLSPLGMPCTEPPFGKIGVVDLNTRKLIWEKPFGTSTDSGPFFGRSYLPLPMGVPNMGGAVSTRAGLFFIAATQERRIRAIDSKTGTTLWSARLPRSGHATPMTYISPKSGRQFVVIAAGGNAAFQSEPGDYVVAFALPPGAGK